MKAPPHKAGLLRTPVGTMACMETALPTLEALQAEAASFIEGRSAKEAGATLITLSGDLGAGKTSYVQGVAKAFGITEHVTSPTFVLEKVYTVPKEANGFARLIHIDAYRLNDGAELNALAFNELLNDKQNLILLEWPERVADTLPPADVAIALRVDGEGRSISYG